MMKNACLFVATMGILFAWSAQPARAEQQCDTVFNEAIGFWNLDSDWNHGSPDCTMVACILENQTVLVTRPDAVAKAIQVSRGGEGDEPGTIRIEGSGRKLTIFDDSILNGAILIQKGAVLEIAEDLIISGNGGEIKGLDVGAPPAKARIDVVTENPPVVRTLTIQGAQSDREHSLVVHGRLDMAAKLVNRAYVVADDGDLVLEDLDPQSRNDKSADGGFWIAEGSGALIVTEGCEVSGSGAWQLVDSSDARIEIHEPCLNLSGEVEITKGTFDLNESFRTTGNLSFKSDSGSEPLIVLREGKTANFGS